MFAFFSVGGPEWIVILIIALLLFGKRLPEVMRSMGRGVSEFKKGLREADEEISRPSGGAGEKGGRTPSEEGSRPSSPAG